MSFRKTSEQWLSRNLKDIGASKGVTLGPLSLLQGVGYFANGKILRYMIRGVNGWIERGEIMVGSLNHFIERARAT